MIKFDDCTYILDENHNVVSATFLEWMEWLTADPTRARVALTAVGNVEVSTVFLGFTMRPGGLVFETMVFGGKFDKVQRRYSTWDEAVAGHNGLVREVEAAEGGST